MIKPGESLKKTQGPVRKTRLSGAVAAGLSLDAIDW